MRRQRFTCFILCLAMCHVGCGSEKGPATGTVYGKVMLDGAPLEDASISFIPRDGIGTASGAKIVNGSYTAKIPLGNKRVEIRAPKVIGTKAAYEGDPQSPRYDIKVELIPSRYNSESELTSNVAKGSNKFDFSLESPKEEASTTGGAN